MKICRLLVYIMYEEMNYGSNCILTFTILDELMGVLRRNNMKRMSRRTKRMIAIMVAYMIVVVNVISAYANENLEGNTLTYSEEEVVSWEGSSGDSGESSYEAPAGGGGPTPASRARHRTLRPSSGSTARVPA